MTPLSVPPAMTDADLIIQTDDVFVGARTAIETSLGLLVPDEHDFTQVDAVHHAPGSARTYFDDYAGDTPANLPLVPPVGYEAGRVAVDTDALAGGFYAGRQWVHTGVLWTSWQSTRRNYAVAVAAALIAASSGGGAWDDWDAANLDLALQMCDAVTRPADAGWAYKCKFQGAFASDTACAIEVRIYNNTDNEVIAYSGAVLIGLGEVLNFSLESIYQPAAALDAMMALKIQVRTSIGGCAISRALDAVLGTGMHTHEVMEIAV